MKDFDRAYLLTANVAGRQYHRADEAWPSLHIGKILSLQYEPDNRHDAYAVAVMAPVGDTVLKLGYLPRTANETLATMLAMGWGDAFRCTISRLDPTASADSQIGVTVAVIRKPDAKSDTDSE